MTTFHDKRASFTRRSLPLILIHAVVLLSSRIATHAQATHDYSLGTTMLGPAVAWDLDYHDLRNGLCIDVITKSETRWHLASSSAFYFGPGYYSLAASFGPCLGTQSSVGPSTNLSLLVGATMYMDINLLPTTPINTIAFFPPLRFYSLLQLRLAYCYDHYGASASLYTWNNLLQTRMISLSANYNFAF